MNAEAEGLTHHLPTSLVRIFHLCFLFPNPFQGLTCYGYLDYFSHDNKGYWDLHDWNTKTGLRRNIGATIKAAKNSKTESDMGQAANKDWDGASSAGPPGAAGMGVDPGSANLLSSSYPSSYWSAELLKLGSGVGSVEGSGGSSSGSSGSVSNGGGGTTTRVDESMTYSTFLFGHRAREIIDAHPRDTPLFLYVPWNAVHNSVSTPAGWNDTAMATTVEGSVTMTLRKQFAGALFLMDQECRAIVDKLKARQLYDDTIIIMASDNGGSPTDGGNNWPLRGAKKTMFEVCKGKGGKEDSDPDTKVRDRANEWNVLLRIELVPNLQDQPHSFIFHCFYY